MDKLKLIISKNIATLRTEAGLTQLELAEKLNYSDKAVSKWERGESVPDVSVLKSIADLFAVTLDYLVTEDHSTPKKATAVDKIKNVGTKNRTIVLLLSLLLVVLVATIAFIIVDEIVAVPYISLICFLYAVPAGLIVWLVFNSIWFNRRSNYFIISLLMWSVLLSVFITISIFTPAPVTMFLLGIPGQIAIFLWSRFE